VLIVFDGSAAARRGVTASAAAGDPCTSSTPVDRETRETSSVRRSLMVDRPWPGSRPLSLDQIRSLNAAGWPVTTHAGVVCPVVGLE
jgi:hypothetical protein